MSKSKSYGVGFNTRGVYKTRENGKKTKAYTVWLNMMQRCYDHKRRKKYPTYDNCVVILEWHNYQVFAKWFYENYIDDYHLDKDLLIKDNKVYSSSTCVFVPQWMNKILTDRGNARGAYPIGVCKIKNKTNPYRAQLMKDSIRINLGCYSTPEAAHKVYMKAKGGWIIKCSNRKDIPSILVERMIEIGKEFLNYRSLL